jgi:hypothetical protein
VSLAFEQRTKEAMLAEGIAEGKKLIVEQAKRCGDYFSSCFSHATILFEGGR